MQICDHAKRIPQLSRTERSIIEDLKSKVKKIMESRRTRCNVHAVIKHHLAYVTHERENARTFSHLSAQSSSANRDKLQQSATL